MVKNASEEDIKNALLAARARAEREQREGVERTARMSDMHRAAHPPGEDAAYDMAMEAIGAVLAALRSDGYAGGACVEGCIRVLTVAQDAIYGIRAIEDGNFK